MKKALIREKPQHDDQYYKSKRSLIWPHVGAVLGSLILSHLHLRVTPKRKHNCKVQVSIFLTKPAGKTKSQLSLLLWHPITKDYWNLSCRSKHAIHMLQHIYQFEERPNALTSDK